MPQIQYITTPALSQYIADLDGELRTGLLYYLANTNLIDATIGSDTVEQIDLIVSGCRIWVRYLQGIDVNREDHQQFFNQDNSYHGTRGKQFWQLLGKGVTFNNQNGSIVTVIKPIINTIPILGTVSQLFDLFQSGRRRENLEGLKRYLQNYIDKFQDFITAWQAEDKKQNPDKYANAPDPKGRTAAKFTATPNPDGTINVTGIQTGDIVSINGTPATPATGNTFVSPSQKDGTHKTKVEGGGLYSYPDTVTVTVKVQLFSSPIRYAENNTTTVLIVVGLVIGFYIMWKRSRVGFSG